MQRVLQIAPAGTWPASVAKAAATLAYADRHRRRISLTADDGTTFLLDLPEARVLDDGDGLLLDGGIWLCVRAADEDVCDVSVPAGADLARMAWHLGNRHLPVQILAGGLRIRDDHVIVEMLQGLGATVTRKRAPFSPEPGAYGRASGHGHEHADGHDHD